jgi:hypothetical protein
MTGGNGGLGGQATGNGRGGDGGTGEGPRIIMQILAPPTILVLNGIGSDIIRELIRCSAETSSSISYWLFKASHIVNLEGKEIKVSELWHEKCTIY